MKTHRHISRRFCVSLGSALIASFSLAGQAKANFDGPGTYIIEVVGTPQVLDIEWNLSNPGQHVLRWLPNNGANQTFNILRSNQGGYVIKPVHSGLCLDLPLGSTAIGTEPIQFACTGLASQRFYIPSIGAGHHAIRTANGNRIFYAPKPGGRVRLAANTASPKTGMRFRFRKI